MATRAPMAGPGSFQWNKGGWFGSQVGSTVWMLAPAVLGASQAPWAAGACFVLFIFANVVGTCLWRRRDRLRPYPAFQFLILAIGISGVLTMISIDLLRPAGLAPSADWKNDFRHGLLVVVAVPLAVMAYAALLEWSTKKASGKQ